MRRNEIGILKNRDLSAWLVSVVEKEKPKGGKKTSVKRK